MIKHSTLLSACLRAGICLVLVLSAHASHGQTVKTINLLFSEKDFSFIQYHDDCLSITTEKYLSIYPEEENSPAIPFINIRIPIEQNSVFKRYSYKERDKKKIATSRLSVSPKIIPTNEIDNTIIHTLPSYNSNIYPTTKVECLGKRITDGSTYILFRVCPFEYDVKSNNLSLIQNIDISIELVKDYTMDNMQKDANQPKIFNKEAAYRSTPNGDFYLENTENGLDYVIITNNLLSGEFEKLARWKRTRGVRTRVVKVDSIYSLYPDESSNILKIKRFIQTYKSLYNIKYILIGGDETVVPVPICYSHARGGCYLPTDLFYSCLDENGFSFDWDSNGNGKRGELEDNIDLMADVSLTRSPVSTINETNIFVNKIVAYEECPPTMGWKHRMLMCGCQLGDSTMVPSDSQRKGATIYNSAIANKWNGALYQFYDTGTDFYGNDSYPYSGENLQNQLNSGYAFVDVISHGGPTSLSMELPTDYYTVDYAQELTCSQPTIITTSACFTNMFTLYDEPCLSEALIRRPTGVVGYLGSSHLGFDFNNTGSLGPSTELSKLFYSKLFSFDNTLDYPRFGNIIKEAKNEFSDNADNDYYRWVLFATNPIGDPEMPIYRETPNVFSDLELNVINDTLIIDTNVNACKLHITSMSDNGISYYRGYDIRYGQHVEKIYLPDIPDSVNICIMRSDYVPIIYKFYRNSSLYLDSSNSMFIQNWQFGGNNFFSAKKYTIGSNVSSNQLNGSVVIKNGTTTIKGKEGVEINGDFEVNIGAEVQITGGQ